MVTGVALRSRAIVRSPPKHRARAVGILGRVSTLDRRARFELAQLGEAIGDPSRAAMLVALLGGVALPASELARAAGVAPSTATSHLQRLGDAGLVVVRAQ